MNCCNYFESCQHSHCPIGYKHSCHHTHTIYVVIYARHRDPFSIYTQKNALVYNYSDDTKRISKGRLNINGDFLLSLVPIFNRMKSANVFTIFGKFDYNMNINFDELLLQNVTLSTNDMIYSAKICKQLALNTGSIK